MRLENIVWDSRDPRRLASFWAPALGAHVMTDDPDLVEARMTLSDEVFLDLCFPRVPDPSSSPQRLHLDLVGGAAQDAIVSRLRGLGAASIDIGQGDVPWVVLADVDGNPFCVMEERPAYRHTGPIAALPLDSADPARDAAFWGRICGWTPYDGVAPSSLRHPAGVGPVLEFCPEPEAKSGKNAMHLDVRAESADGDLVGRACELGATVLEFPGVDALPWTVLADPSGNEFCILDAVD